MRIDWLTETTGRPVCLLTRSAVRCRVPDSSVGIAGSGTSCTAARRILVQSRSTTIAPSIFASSRSRVARELDVQHEAAGAQLARRPCRSRARSGRRCGRAGCARGRRAARCRERRRPGSRAAGRRPARLPLRLPTSADHAECIGAAPPAGRTSEGHEIGHGRRSDERPRRQCRRLANRDDLGAGERRRRSACAEVARPRSPHARRHLARVGRDQRVREPQPGRLGQPPGDAGDPPDLAGQAHLADRDQARGERVVRARRRRPPGRPRGRRPAR